VVGGRWWGVALGGCLDGGLVAGLRGEGAMGGAGGRGGDRGGIGGRKGARWKNMRE